MKISGRIENIFSHAVAMDNRGLKNMIHCIGHHVFIVNFDHSMILRFSLRKNELAFDVPLSFNANDYDSSDVEQVGNRIVFRTAQGGYERKKMCGASPYDPLAIRKLYHALLKRVDEGGFSFQLSEDCCALMDPALSHVELSVEAGQLVLRQRNVYSGSVIEITPKRSGGLLEDLALPASVTFGPVGLKTQDFTSLFAFHPALTFQPGENFLLVREPRLNDFDAVVGWCQYDEIVKLYEGEQNGRQEPEDGIGEPEAGATAQTEARPTKQKARTRRRTPAAPTGRGR